MSRIDDLLADPKFKQLMISNPDKAREFVSQMKQQDFGIMPHSENLLTNAIKNATGFSRGFANVETLGLNNLAEKGADTLTNMLPFSPEEKQKSLDATNQITHPHAPMAELAGASVPLAHATVSLVGAGAKGIGKLFGEKAARQGLSEVAYTGANEAKDAVQSATDEATQAFGEGLDKLKPEISGSDLGKAARDAAQEMGVTTVSGHPLLVAADKLESLGSNPLSGREVQMQIKNVTDKLSDLATRSTFYKKVMDVLPESHQALKSAYAPLFNIIEQGKLLTKGALARVGRGINIGGSELADLKQAEDTLGLNLLEKAINAGKNIDRAKTAKTIAKIGIPSAVGLGIGSHFIKDLINKQ